MKFRNALFALLAAPCFCTTAAASGIPTFDGAAALNFVQQFLQMTKDYEMYTMQYQQLVTTYNQAVMQYKSMTGTRGLGAIYHARAFESLVSSAYRQALDLTVQNGYTYMSGPAKEFYEKFKLGESCSNLTGENLVAYQNAQAAAAERAAALEEVDTNTTKVLDEVNGLMNEVNKTTDMKATADLTAQIVAKNAAIQASNTKLQAQMELMKMKEETVKKKAQQKVHNNFFKKLSDQEIEDLMR